MNMARKLRLGPLPSTSSTKLTFACPASLKMDLTGTPLFMRRPMAKRSMRPR